MWEIWSRCKIIAMEGGGWVADAITGLRLRPIRQVWLQGSLLLPDSRDSGVEVRSVSSFHLPLYVLGAEAGGRARRVARVMRKYLAVLLDSTGDAWCPLRRLRLGGTP